MNKNTAHNIRSPSSGVLPWHVSGRLLLIAIAGLCVGSSRAGELWQDDFESYPTGGLGSPWVLSGNADASVTQERSVSGSQSVRMYGQVGSCWATHAHRYVGTNQILRISFNVAAGGESLTGCHPIFAIIQMSAGPSWTYDSRTLLEFHGNGLISGGDDTASLPLGVFQSNIWYSVRILYDRSSTTNVLLSFFVNDQLKGVTTYPAGVNESGLSYLSVGSGEGTTWYDDVRVEDAATQMVLSIEQAVHVGWSTTTNVAYQVQTSSNLLGGWTSIGPLVEGTGGEVGEFFLATNSQGFFMVQETGASGIDWLEGRWQGLVGMAFPSPYVTNTQIVQLSVTNNNRQFEATFSVGSNPFSVNLPLVSYSATDARFLSPTQVGGPLNGRIIVSRIDETNVGAFFYIPGTLGGGGGVLTKQ